MPMIIRRFRLPLFFIIPFFSKYRGVILGIRHWSLVIVFHVVYRFDDCLV